MRASPDVRDLSHCLEMAAPMDMRDNMTTSERRGRESESDGPQPLSPAEYKFTPDELRVLKECNRDSFFQRSLPLGIGMGIGTYLGVQSGYLKGSARWGPTPKVVLAVTVAYFLGKFSYQSKCAEKIMQLPNSPLAEMLRRRRQHGKGGFQEALSMDPSFGSAITSVGPQDVYSDIGPRYDIDSPSDRPYQAGLNDSYRPSVDSTFIEEEPLPEIPPSHSTTYEELRRKNRDEYEQKKTKPYRGVTGPEDIPSVIRPQSRQDTSANTPKNKYGDSWDE